MIKFGFRRSLLYPGLFILFICLRRITKYILETFVAKGLKFSFLMIILIFICEIIIGIIYLLYQKKKPSSPIKSQFLGIPLNNEYAVLTRPDGNFRIILIVFFASFFTFEGAVSRRYVTNHSQKDIYDEFHAKYRSSEIIIASILCYFTLKNKIYRHHSFSLIIILICLIIVFSVGIISNDHKKDLLENIGITLVSSICRAFLDTSEKYLFDINFVDIFKLMVFEGIISILLSSTVYFFDRPKNEIKDLFDTDRGEFWGIILLLIVYGMLSGFKNVFRRYTVKKFTPMTRALAESILDPIFIIYGYFQGNEDKLSNFITTLICSFIMIFCSCIYNEVFVLYCFGLQNNTHLEIANQNESLELSTDSDRNSIQNGF